MCVATDLKLNVQIGILSLTVSSNNWLSRYILCLSVTSFRNKVSNFSQPNCTRLVKVVLNWAGCTVVLWRISRVIFRYVFGSVKRCLRCLWKLWKASMCTDVVKLSSKQRNKRVGTLYIARSYCVNYNTLLQETEVNLCSTVSGETVGKSRTGAWSRPIASTRPWQAVYVGLGIWVL